MLYGIMSGLYKSVPWESNDILHFSALLVVGCGVYRHAQAVCPMHSDKNYILFVIDM